MHEQGARVQSRMVTPRMRAARVTAGWLAALVAALLAALALWTGGRPPETIRVSHGYGLLYLPLMVMQSQGLIEKQASAMGIAHVRVQWTVLDGGNLISDAMLAGNLDVAGIGVPGFLTLWSKARGIPRSEVVGISALSSAALSLDTNRPRIRSMADFRPGDRIAIPGVRTSLESVALEMAAAKVFGLEHYDKLDALTLSLSHPAAVRALLAPKGGIDAHFASPPFSFEELQSPKVHRILDSTDVLGDVTLDVVFAAKHFVQKHPRLISAFLAAQRQADAYIEHNPRAAAELYLRVSHAKLSVGMVERMLADPSMKFSTTPVGVMGFARFMSRVGEIQVKPTSWTDLFVPEIQGGHGS